MGGQPWGGATIPLELKNAYAAYAGMDKYSDSAEPDFSGPPIYPFYNLREEMERLWTAANEHIANGSFDADDGSGNLDSWWVGVPLPDGVATNGWTWSQSAGKVTHSGATTVSLEQAGGYMTAFLEHGKIYRVRYTISGRTTGKVQMQLGDGTGGKGQWRIANGMYIEDIQCDESTNTTFFINPADSFDGAIEDVSVMSLMDCPYALATLHDPNPDVDAVDTRYSTYNGEVTAMNPATDWASDAAAVKTAVNANVSWVSEIDTIVGEYENDQLPELLRSQTRFLSTLAGGGAIHSTAAWKGLGIMEGQFNRGSGNFRATAMLAGYQDRAKAILSGVSEVQAARKFKIESGRMATAMKADIAKMNILANNDFIREQLQLDVEAEMWNINLLDKVKSVNTITGAPVLQRGLTSGQAMTSLAFSALGGVANLIPAIAKML